jgi:hypothetical protein
MTKIEAVMPLAHDYAGELDENGNELRKDGRVFVFYPRKQLYCCGIHNVNGCPTGKTAGMC